MTRCPSRAELEEYHAQALPQEQASGLRAHLAACPECTERLGQMVAEVQVIENRLQDLQGRAARGIETAGETQSTGASKGRTNGIQIEGYDVIREVRRGGQGVVYEAIEKDTKRRVAVKVLLHGAYTSKDSQKRFDREIELVAQLHHPNIISLLHSGFTREGHRFCVMDYVQGVPLNQYVRSERLPLEQTLELFCTVCEGVQFAHQRGIIHRDLKPANILVDHEGRPHLLDFGLAKLLAAPVETLVSMLDSVMGTVPYMSPEQATGNTNKVDTRADIYSLGVVLYELLTGHHPYPTSGQMSDVLRHITESAPTPPRRRWMVDSGITRRSSKGWRPGRCPIDADLETIVLKTLSKERERRYQSAGELAQDLQRYLEGMPITARPESILYIIRKRLLRHKKAVAVQAALALSIMVAIVLALWLQDRKKAEKAEALVKEGRNLLEQGERELAYWKFQEAAMTDPSNYSALGNQALALKREYFGRPLSDANPGVLKFAQELCKFSLTLNPASAGTLNLLAVIQYSLGDLDAAEQSCRAALRVEPSYYWAESTLAKVMALQHRFDEALEAAHRGTALEESGRSTRPEPKGYGAGVWVTLGTSQLCMKRPEALESLQNAQRLASDRYDHHLIRARLHLTLTGHVDPSKALEQAQAANVHDKKRLDPRVRRVLALACLRNGLDAEAAANAQAAIDEGDVRSYGELIAAIAEARPGNNAAARKHLDTARTHWPEQFKKGETVIVTAEKELLWIDTAAELEGLVREAEAAMAGSTPPQP